MTVDARCLIATDLGILKDGSGLSEDHAQGSGLITYRGTFIFDGIHTPARGRVIQLAYARPQYGLSGTLTRFYPRLHAISFSADPFINQTTVEVGCRLELMRGAKEQVVFRAEDNPPAWWLALTADRRAVVPPTIALQDVIEECLIALEIPLAAGSATTPDIKAVDFIDLSDGYVTAIEAMLRSAQLLGHMTPNGELLVQPMTLAPTTGPAITRDNILALQPINDRAGAEVVSVEFAAVEESPTIGTPGGGTGPNGRPAETVSSSSISGFGYRDWELEKTVSPPEVYEIVYQDSDGNQQSASYSHIATTETTTTYETIRFRDSQGIRQSQDVVRKRVTVATGCRADANPSMGSSLLANGRVFPGSLPDVIRTETIFIYDITSNGPRAIKEIQITYHSIYRFVGSLGIRDYVIDGVSLSLSDSPVLISRVEIASDVNELAAMTRRSVTRYSATGKKQSGNQGAASPVVDVTSIDQLSAIIQAAKVLVCEGTEVTTSFGRLLSSQPRPSAQDRQSNNEGRVGQDGSGDPVSPYKAPLEQIVTAKYIFGGAPDSKWDSITYQLPFAPDDFYYAENGPTAGLVTRLIVRGQARQRALSYGEIQNAIAYGHANGVELTTAPWELPSPPFAQVYIEILGLVVAYRVHGRNWEIRNGAMALTADLCLVGVVGRLVGETPQPWMPLGADPMTLNALGAPSGSGELLPANTITLPGGFNPDAPGSVWSSLPTNGTDSYGPSRTPAAIAPPYVQTVQILARSRSAVVVTELLYSVAPVTEDVLAVSRSRAVVAEILSITELITATSRSKAFVEEVIGGDKLYLFPIDPLALIPL